MKGGRDDSPATLDMRVDAPLPGDGKVEADVRDARTSLPPAEVIQHLGRLTRTLHESLSGLGYDKKLQAAAAQLPDTRERLAHVGNLTWLAAERVLSAVEESRTLQDEVQVTATSLLHRWQVNMSFGRPVSRDLADDTCAFLERSLAIAALQNERLEDIMLAQDFHDLTGQLLRRVATLAQDLERDLLRLLLDTATAQSAVAQDAGTHADRVHTQVEVDALLESMGF